MPTRKNIACGQPYGHGVKVSVIRKNNNNKRKRDLELVKNLK